MKDRFPISDDHTPGYYWWKRPHVDHSQRYTKRTKIIEQKLIAIGRANSRSAIQREIECSKDFKSFKNSKKINNEEGN